MSYDFSKAVDALLNNGESGLKKKQAAVSCIEGFSSTLQKMLSERYCAKFQVYSMPSRETNDESSFSLSSILGQPQSKTKSDVLIKVEGEGKSKRNFKLFSYEFDAVSGMPVTLRYNEGSVSCADITLLCKALEGVVAEQAVSLVEWCRS